LNNDFEIDLFYSVNEGIEMKDRTCGIHRPARIARGRAGTSRRQRGASLLEAIAYLGIAAIVVVGAIALLRGAFDSANSNELSEQVSALQTGVRKLYMGQPGGYATLDNQVVQNAGIFPATLVPSGTGTTTVQDTWSGNVTLTGTATNFTIEFDAVPNDVCINAVTESGSWSSISVNGTAETPPVSPATASGVCTAGTNAIIWTST
jgi:hypothetical protein